MKDYIYMIAFCVVAGAAALFTMFLIGWLVIEFISQHPAPAPTTYHTGLYVESEQVQQTIDGKELQ
jgi:hypothetical protein